MVLCRPVLWYGFLAQPSFKAARNKSRHSHHKWCWDAATRRPCAQRYMLQACFVSSPHLVGSVPFHLRWCNFSIFVGASGFNCLANARRLSPVLLCIGKQFSCRLAPIGDSIAYDVSLGFGQVCGWLRVRLNLLSRTTKTIRSKRVAMFLASERFA